MLNSLSDKKKVVISWIGYVVSLIIFVVQIVVSFSPASDSGSELTGVAVLTIVLGIINVALLVFGTVLFSKNANTEKGKSGKVIGIVLRVILLIFVALLSVVWVIGFFK